MLFRNYSVIEDLYTYATLRYSSSCSFFCLGARIKIAIMNDTTHSTPITIKVGLNPPRSAPIKEPASAPNPNP